MKHDWEYKRLGEVGSFQRGKGIQKTHFVTNGMPCIHYGQIHTTFGVSTLNHISEIPQDLYEQSIIASKGDVLLALTSEDVEGSCKSTAWLGDYDVAISSDAAVFKHNLNPKFVVYYTQTKAFFIEKSKYARGFKVTHIKTSDIETIPIPVPSIEIQSLIVSELDSLSQIIADCKETLKDYDALEQSIFYDMFGDPVKNDKGWEEKELKSICREIGDGLHGTPEYSDNSNLYFVNGNNLNDGIIDIKENTKSVTETAYKQHYIDLDEKTLLISINGTLGKVAFYRNEKIILGKSACYLKVGNDIDIIFLYRLLSSEYFKNYMESECTGTTIRNVSLKSMRTYNCPLPPLPLQKQFASKIEAIEQMKSETKKALQEAETLFNARMDYWFN